MPPHLRFTHSTSHSHPCGTYCALILQRDNAIFSWKDGWLLLFLLIVKIQGTTLVLKNNAIIEDVHPCIYHASFGVV
jgi:hypothetical protein